MPKVEPTDLFAAAPLPVATLGDMQRLACLRLIRSENVGPATFRALINHYGGAREALSALPAIARKAGRARPVAIYPEKAAVEEIEAARKAGVELLFSIEPGFPAPLAFADGAPPMLYVKGRVELLGRPTIAIVGSRQASAAGLQVARGFAAAFGTAGYTVCSGLARGIDAAAHQATLESGTIAVLAGGIDVVYPPEHRRLQGEIGERGCLISEQPMGFQPRAQDFPRRNRIISGISRAVVVVEAAKRSGTLITARLANEQGREVFAVPGHPLDPRAEGTNQLLKDGASIATTADDVLEALARQDRKPGFKAFEEPRVDDLEAHLVSGQSRAQPAPPVVAADAPAAVDHADIIDAVRRVLGPAPVKMDEVARATGIPARHVQVAIMELVLVGAVQLHGGQLVSLIPTP